MIQILIWNCQYWKFDKKFDWLSSSNIDVIIETKKDDRFRLEFDKNSEEFSKRINDSNSIEKWKFDRKFLK